MAKLSFVSDAADAHCCQNKSSFVFWRFVDLSILIEKTDINCLITASKRPPRTLSRRYWMKHWEQNVCHYNDQFGRSWKSLLNDVFVGHISAPIINKRQHITMVQSLQPPPKTSRQRFQIPRMCFNAVSVSGFLKQRIPFGIPAFKLIVHFWQNKMSQLFWKQLSWTWICYRFSLVSCSYVNPVSIFENGENRFLKWCRENVNFIFASTRRLTCTVYGGMCWRLHSV